MKRIPFEYAVLAISVGVTFAVAPQRRAMREPAPTNSRAASTW